MYVLFDGIGSNFVTFSSAFEDGDLYYMELSYTSSTQLCYLTRTNITNASDSETQNITLSNLGEWGFTALNIGRRGNSSRYLQGELFDLNIDTGFITHKYPLQGSTYDISGNGNHGVNNGCDLTAVQDDFHYNLRKGFGENISSDFIPRLANNSGFPATVTEEHIAGTWNNMPESYFRFKNTLTSDIMDKSDVGIWSADIRASVHYDSSNPRDWHSSELVQEYLDTNINPTYKDRIFVADDNTTFVKDGGSWVFDGDDYVVEFGDGATESKQVLIYDTQQTGGNLEKIIKFLAKQY